MTELLLLLADGRWPGGGHAHSGGLEAAVAEGAVTDGATLRSFLEGRLSTTGATDAWFAAAAHGTPIEALAALQARYEARIVSGAQRVAGRSLGRGLRRTASAIWPRVADCRVEQHVLVLGLVARCAGLPSDGAARLALHSLLTSAATAAPKLFAIDMVDALRTAVDLAPAADAIAAAIGSLATPPPPRSAPLAEARAERHSAWDVRLFAS